jgi:hypothetical protein
MERARATWTDERLDDLSHRVDDGFNRVDEDLRQMRTEMNSRFDGLEGRLGERIDGVEGRLERRIGSLERQLGGRIDGLEARFDSLQRTMIQVGGGMIVTVLATLATVLART